MAVLSGWVSDAADGAVACDPNVISNHSEVYFPKVGSPEIAAIMMMFNQLPPWYQVGLPLYTNPIPALYHLLLCPPPELSLLVQLQSVRNLGYAIAVIKNPQGGGGDGSIVGGQYPLPLFHSMATIISHKCQDHYSMLSLPLHPLHI